VKEGQEINSILLTVPKTINPKAIPCLAMRDPLNMDLYLLCNNIHHTVAIEKFTLVQ
jgi:hypothetical protein